MLVSYMAVQTCRRAVQRPVAITVLLTMLLSIVAPMTASAQTADLRTEIQNTLNVLNPVSLALNGLVDNAIAKGDSVLQRRLEQMNGIIQSAIFNLDQMLKSRIDQLDQAAKNRLAQSLTGLQSLAREVDSILRQNIDRVDELLATRITQFQTQVGGVVAALPIAFDPLVNAGLTGIYLVKQDGPLTALYLTGAGLFKKGESPRAWLLLPSGENRPVTVTAASMGLLEIALPNRILTDTSTPTTYRLRLKLRRGGWLTKDYAEPTIPIHICGRIKDHTIRATLVATGQTWEYGEVSHPDARQSGFSFYVETNRGNAGTKFCAKAPPGWVVNTDKHDGVKWQYGLFVDYSGGGGYTDNHWEGPGCYALYCDDRWGNCNAQAGNVRVAVKRLVASDPCAPPIVQTASLRYGTAQFQFDMRAALGGCQTGLSNDPVHRLRLDIIGPDQKVVEIRDVPVGGTAFAVNRTLQVAFSSSGLLDLDFRSSCRPAP